MQADRTILLPGLDVSRETIEDLRAFLAMVEKWNLAINLISRSTAFPELLWPSCRRNCDPGAALT